MQLKFRNSFLQPKIDESDHRLRLYGYGFKKNSKRALLSYLPQPILDEQNGQESVRFSNHGIALSWARVLNELGYILDIINWDDTFFKPQERYDLVIFHGGKNYNKIQGNLSGSPAIIHFSTGSYWKFNNAQENKRLQNFKKLHGVSLPQDRPVEVSEDRLNSDARGIIVIGGSFTKSTYAKYPNVYAINNASYHDSHFNNQHKNYEHARKNFLFYAGAGNIHKGLDLVIDAFKDLEEHLYIVTMREDKFNSVFKDELKMPNIHMLSEVNMRTEEFYYAMCKCAWVVLPSCSEGQAGSVVEAMNQGLIPIVSSQSGLDARGYGVVLRENTIDCIKEAVTRMSSLEADEVEKMAIKTRKVAMRDHNPEKFRKDLKKAIKTILKSA